ncbi:DoxX family protein [Actinomadura barringtoniae]|uniref:DoxX family protein n=1 Tax=Actinomadura barringtoniae TaxID=1427535 RepID=A0A939P623_9ACTN|nr:DoxX family protein [Actinomadura barringtoniae]MBO2446067.1 DoxX family protein [Actinomadura barringtoniae]
MTINPLRVAARALTGSTYAVLGFEAAREPGGRVEMAGSTLAAVRKVAPLPEDDELLVRANGAAMAVAGTTLALGLFPRVSTAVLAASLVPTTLAGHAFWAIDDEGTSKMQRVQFQKNLAMIGGLVFAFLDAQQAASKRKARRSEV